MARDRGIQSLADRWLGLECFDIVGGRRHPFIRTSLSAPSRPTASASLHAASLAPAATSTQWPRSTGPQRSGITWRAKPSSSRGDWMDDASIHDQPLCRNGFVEVPGDPGHLMVAGMPQYRVIPYHEVELQVFSCFPFFLI